MQRIKLELSEYDKTEQAAAKIIKYFSERLTKLRLDNDDYDSHISIRGRIAEIKEFQKFLEPAKILKTSTHVKSM